MGQVQNVKCYTSVCADTSSRINNSRHDMWGSWCWWSILPSSRRSPGAAAAGCASRSGYRFCCISASWSVTQTRPHAAQLLVTQGNLFLCQPCASSKTDLSSGLQLLCCHLVSINYWRRLAKSGKHQILSAALGHPSAASWQTEQPAQCGSHL